jgi:hypothetical protein
LGTWNIDMNIGEQVVVKVDLLSRPQVVILIIIPFRRIIGSPHLFGFTSVIWGAVGMARDPPGAHHPGLKKIKTLEGL